MDRGKNQSPVRQDELKKLANERLKEAKVLAERGYFDGAIYLAGYVVELALKARICSHLDLEEYRNENYFLTHEYPKLIILGGLRKKLIEQKKNEAFFNNWSEIEKWGPELRYRPIGSVEERKNEAEAYLNALEDVENGVFTWVQSLW